MRLILTALFAAVGTLSLAAEAPKGKAEEPKPKAEAPPPAPKSEAKTEPKAAPAAKAEAPAPAAKAAPKAPPPAPKAEPKAEAKAEPEFKPTPAPKPESLLPGTYALLKTAKGEILVQLLPEDAPNTEANFVELAKGERPWKDSEGRWVAKPYYDGLTFHRVEADDLIQGGCPRGDGTGGPGYEFDNETSDKLKFDQPGVVAMANAGRNTNGSQFFITLGPSPAYDGKYAIFGKVVHGLDVVKAISRVPATEEGGLHKAKEPVAIEKVAIYEVKAKSEAPKPAAK